ncbi:MAG: hypothetical protein WC915_01455 [archaeon]|jgi:hypothetical protein
MSGFFSKFFKKKEQVTLKTTIDLLPTIIQKNFESKINELEIEVAKEMSQVKYLHEKLVTLLKDIETKELESKENERFNRAATTAKQQVEKQLAKTLEKINPTNCGNNLDDFRAYSSESYVLLVNEVNSFRKNLVFTSVYLKDEMKLFGITLQELLNKLNNIRNKLDQEKEIFEFEKIKKKIIFIGINKKELEEVNKQITNLENLLKQKDIEIKSQEEKLFELTTNDASKKLKELTDTRAQISNEKQALKIEVSSMLSTIDRPLQRFNAIVKNGMWKISKDQEELLEGFITNPLLALKQDVNGKRFKEILKEILSAIEDGKIDIKPKEKEKRIDALQELINFDFFEQVFWKLNEIQKRLIEIEKELKENVSKKEIDDETSKNNQLQRDKTKILEEIEHHKKTKITINEKLEEEEKRIIDFAQNSLNKKILITK